MAGESGRLGLPQGTRAGARAAGEGTAREPARGRSARKGRGREEAAARAPRRAGLPVVNIYLTSATPHSQTPPPPPAPPPRALPPHLVAGARGAGLARALSARSARRSCSPADARPPCR